MTWPSPISRADLVRQLLELGVEPGGVVLVHTSFRAVRPVEGGPEGLIQALREALGPDGTLVMPSWSADADRPFDPRVSVADPALGVVPQVFWRLTGVHRSAHVHAFAAAGPEAETILRDFLPLPPHRAESPVGRVRDLDGQILLLGVNHDANTTVHLAELVANVAYGIPKYCTVLEDDGPVRVEYRENDHCCQRFVLVDDWLRAAGLQSEGVVGHSVARLTRSQSVVTVVADRLRQTPTLFLHEPDQQCAECEEAWRSIRSQVE